MQTILEWVKENPAQITAGILLTVRILECVQIALKTKPTGIIEFVKIVWQEFKKFN